jgi:hypothetical protein
MSETYQSKRERWHRMKEALPADLRPHVALRNVEAVSSLPPKAQTRLTEAVRASFSPLFRFDAGKGLLPTGNRPMRTGFRASDLGLSESMFQVK